MAQCCTAQQGYETPNADPLQPQSRPKSVEPIKQAVCEVGFLNRRNAACSCPSIVQFATGPKISMGHVPGAKNSFAVRRRTRPQGGRTSEILSNRGPEVSLGAPRVATRRAQAPTPHARRLPSVHTYKQGPLRSIALDHDLPKISIQSSLGSTKTRSEGAPARSFFPSQRAGVVFDGKV